MIKNLPANTGDSGSSPDLGKIAHAMEQLPLCTQLLSLCARARSCDWRRQCSEKPASWTREEPLLSTSRRKRLSSNQDPTEPKVKISKKNPLLCYVELF